MWGLSSLTAPESRIDKYRRYRKVGLQLHASMIQLPWYGSYFQTACTHLGYRDARGFSCPPADDGKLAVVFDYAQHEVHEDGETFLETSRDAFVSLSRVEEELLEAGIDAQAGLYRILNADPDASQLTVEDLTDPGHQLLLTDVMMSLTYSKVHRCHDFMMIRPICLPDFTMTSGFSCVFAAEQERAALKLWDKHQDAVRFAQIARFHKTKGIPTLQL